MRLPPGTDVRLGLMPDVPAYFVFIAPAPLKAGTHLLDLVNRPGEVAALLTHDAGVNWTDRHGVALAESVLTEGGAVIMQFETMADALAAHRRLLREGVR